MFINYLEMGSSSEIVKFPDNMNLFRFHSNPEGQ